MSTQPLDPGTPVMFHQPVPVYPSAASLDPVGPPANLGDTGTIIRSCDPLWWGRAEPEWYLVAVRDAGQDWFCRAPRSAFVVLTPACIAELA